MFMSVVKALVKMKKETRERCFGSRKSDYKLRGENGPQWEGVSPLASLTFPVSVVNTDGGSEKKNREWHASHELAMHEVANVQIAEKREKGVADRKKSTVLAVRLTGVVRNEK